jgi:hypothetical protein
LTFPVKISPFTKEELLNRLPLEFHVQSPYFYDDSINHDNINGVNDNSNADANAISKDNLSFNLSVSKFMTFIVQQVTDRQSSQEDVGFGEFLCFNCDRENFYIIAYAKKNVSHQNFKSCLLYFRKKKGGHQQLS